MNMIKIRPKEGDPAHISFVSFPFMCVFIYKPEQALGWYPFLIYHIHKLEIIRIFDVDFFAL